MLKVLDAGVRPTQALQELIDLSGVQFTPSITPFINLLQKNEKEASKVTQHTVSSVHRQAFLQSMLMKESKFIPNLIMYLEKYEVLLIKLCKQSKVSDMLIEVRLYVISLSLSFSLCASVCVCRCCMCGVYVLCVCSSEM